MVLPPLSELIINIIFNRSNFAYDAISNEDLCTPFRNIETKVIDNKHVCDELAKVFIMRTHIRRMQNDVIS